MNNAVFTFSKPSPNSIIASNRIASFISTELELPLIHDEKIREHWDILFVVNGAFAFSKHRDELGWAIQRAKRVVWCQNDYTIVCPTNNGTAQTPFRRAFTKRKELKRPDVDRWTTVQRWATFTEDSHWINWNCLTARKKRLPIREPQFERAFYYGAHRNGRVEAFEKYFVQAALPVTVLSATPKKFWAYSKSDKCLVEDGSLGADTLNRYAYGLYLEDTKSHTENHCPANRFYEMLGAGLPMLFQPECENMLMRSGINTRLHRIPMYSSGWKDRLHIRDIAAEQQQRWWKPFRRHLTNTLHQHYEALCRKL